MASSKYFEIHWLDGDAYGSADIIPVQAFKKRHNEPFAYNVRIDGVGLREVRFHITVSGKVATLDYCSDKADRRWNERSDWYLGIMRLAA